MESNLECSVCLSRFDDDDKHRPHLLPLCGHTFCAFCLKQLYVHKENRDCPVCRKPNAVRTIERLPVNYALLGVSDAVNDQHKKKMNNDDKQQALPLANDEHAQCSGDSEYFPRNKGRYTRTSRAVGNDTGYRPSFNYTVDNSNRDVANSRRQPGYIPSVEAPENFNTSLINYSLQRSNSLNQTRPSSNAPPNLTKLLNRQNRHSTCNFNNNSCNNQLQEEIDFQMAVHLTFCKDKSHNHDDDDLNVGSWPIPTAYNTWQYPLDNDIDIARSFVEKR